MLLAARLSAVTKKPRLRLTMRRSSSVRPLGSFHSRDVALHVDLLRHPVVGAGGEVFLPGPLVLERHQLVDVGLAVDDALVGDVDAARATVAGARRRLGAPSLRWKATDSARRQAPPVAGRFVNPRGSVISGLTSGVAQKP